MLFRSHPLVTSFLHKYPEAEKSLQYLLQQISLSIPLNNLYIDLTNDEKIANDSDRSESEIIELLKTIIETVESENRYELIQTLKNVEPFCNYVEAIDSAIKRGKLL